MSARVSVFPRREMYVLQYPNVTIISKFTAALQKETTEAAVCSLHVCREFGNSQSKIGLATPVKHSHPVLFSGLLISLIFHFGI